MDLFGQQIQLACVGVEAGTFWPVGWVPRLGGGEHRVLGGPDGPRPLKTASSKCRPQVSGRVLPLLCPFSGMVGGVLRHTFSFARLSNALFGSATGVPNTLPENGRRVVVSESRLLIAPLPFADGVGVCVSRQASGPWHD